jgi:hypothetical protein
MYFFIVSLPTFSPTSPNTVFTECVSASVSVMSPNDSPPSLLRGTPEMTLPLRPLMRDCGVYWPESIAAIAVTTLKVEPGG